MNSNHKWKRIGSGMLAVCLVVTLVMSNQSFGVFAEEDGTAGVHVEESQTDQSQADQSQADQSQMEESNEVETNAEKIQKNAEGVSESSNTEESQGDIQESEESGTEENSGLHMGEEENASEEVLENENYSLEEASESDVAVQSEEDANLIVFDLSKGSVTFTDSNYSGFDSNGNENTGTYDASKKYEIIQSDPSTATSNTISVGTESKAVAGEFNIYLSGINICVTDVNACPIYVNSGENGKVYLILKDKTKNIVNINCLKSNRHAAIEKELDSSGLLCIACEEGYKAYLANPVMGHVCEKNNSCGELCAYANKAEIASNNGAYVSGAGIGSRGQVNGGRVDLATGEIKISRWLENITIAGGIISAFGAAGDENSSGGGAGIGTGSCYNSTDTGAGLRNFYITGGYIEAKAGDDSASCIGGGYRSNEVQVSIYNGTIIATERIITTDRVRGTGIGAGGGGTQSGSPSTATVKIYGGIVTASSQYGAAIGGAGSGDGTGSHIGERAGSQPAYVSIYGGNIQAISTKNGAAIGTGGPYGNTTTGRAGDANVEITGGIVNAESEAGADIGGGGVTSNENSSNGGNANITISGGMITAKKGGIGGGLAVAGAGGDANILITGGTVVTPSIGGGNSTSNQGGNAKVKVTAGNLTVSGTIGGGDSESGQAGDASIYVSDGTLDCASIGGGNSMSGMPGSVTSDSQNAGVVVIGGTLKTGTIGGGKNDSGDIGFATAEISGGNIQGQFVLANTDVQQKCFFHMTGGTIDNSNLGDDKYAKAQSNGGAVYLSDPKGEVKISGGTIQHATAELGGAVYMTNGNFMLSGDATIQNCKANGNDTITAQGGAVYLDNGTVTMDGGCILSSSAVKGGAVYLNDGTVTLSNGTIGKENSANSATEGAGVYVAGGTLVVKGGSIMHNTATNGAGAYLQSGSMEISSGQILHNTASENGAGAYLAGGTLQVSGGIMTENTATQNGGGVFLNAGNMTLSGGRIYGNSAVNGAGAYLEGGNLNMSGSGDFDLNTASKDGGGAYLAGGALTVDSGTFSSNIASENGGGAYLAGGLLTINGGSFDNNTATNGGGAYAADGQVRMFGGYIRNNTANQSGGGFYVSSDQKAADVVIRSGTISGNKAGKGTASAQGNGGAIAVVSSNGAHENDDHVVIGLRHQHPGLDMTTRKFTSFEYSDSIDNEKNHTHDSCPIIKDNQAAGNGGGIYMDSSASILDIYCLLEENNKAEEDATGGSIMSVGGNVNIGDAGEDGKGNNTVNAVGNILIKSKMLVKGGAIKIFGNTDNPGFSDQILVDIQEKAGSFEDNRFTQITGDVNYKIEYFENFHGSGIFTAMQYEEDEDIPSMGTMYVHEGYKIIGWAKNAIATTPDYTTESGTLIGSKDNHEAWDGKKATEALKLYAIWQKISYTVVYHANATEFSGNMENQSFTYEESKPLTQNTYKVKGKRFANWNKNADGTGESYEELYTESKMTSVDGATVDLYAQWVDCSHGEGEHIGTLSYSLNGTKDTITETCDCGNYVETLKISGADVYYDGAEHPATLSGQLYAFVPEISYSYSAGSEGNYGAMPDGTTKPIEVGYYKASIAVGGETAVVEYQIKSAASAATIDVAAKKGQYFTNIKKDGDCTVAQDDAFTVQYQVQALNKGVNEDTQKGYVTAPVLTIDQALPVGTTIIMQTGDAYWYNNQLTGTEIALTSFQRMGGTDFFDYATESSAILDTQTYRFIVDFSKVQENTYITSGTSIKIGLKYAYTNPQTKEPKIEQDKEEKATIMIGSKTDFGVVVLSDNSNQVTATAPSDITDTRWEQKNLVWKIATGNSTEKLPSDAKLTLTTTENGSTKTVISSLNSNGEFIIPFDWEASKDFTFSLASSQEVNENKTYEMTAALYVGSRSKEMPQPMTGEDNLKKASDEVSLTIPAKKEPALKISSNQKVLSKTDTLKVNITYSNITIRENECSITAVIRKKDQNGVYNESSNFGQKTITAEGAQDISLASIDGTGSYCLWVTVAKKNADGTSQTLLEVPYYFVVRE